MNRGNVLQSASRLSLLPEISYSSDKTTKKSDIVEKSKMMTDDPTTENADSPLISDDSCIPNQSDGQQDKDQN